MKQHVEAGLAARNGGDLDTAIREFRRVAEMAPDLPAAHVNLGAVYLDKKDYTRCDRSFCDRSFKEGPGVESRSGRSSWDAGHGAAGPGIQGRIHIVPGEKAGADDLLGVAYLETGRWRDAVDKLEAALQKRPNDPDLLYYLAQAHGRLSKQVVDRLMARNPERLLRDSSWERRTRRLEHGNRRREITGPRSNSVRTCAASTSRSGSFTSAQEITAPRSVNFAPKCG